MSLVTCVLAVVLLDDNERGLLCAWDVVRWHLAGYINDLATCDRDLIISLVVEFCETSLFG